jgi:tetratricopeptide (TPR) repeat protein
MSQRGALMMPGMRLHTTGTMKTKNVGFATPSKLLLTIVVALKFTAAIAGNPKLLEEAQKQLAAGNAKQAFAMLQAQQERFAGEEDFDYWLGVAALDSGKIDDAIIAFERVLAVNPMNAAAQLDLARAYFTAGSFDLAEGTFLKLKASNPPPAAQLVIDKYLATISDRRTQARKKLFAWGETSLGYDSNLTGVPKDFTSAVASAFNLLGINATGNSIKRKAPYIAGALGADYYHPLSAEWTALIGGEARARAYRHEAEFNSYAGDLRAGAYWTRGQNQLRFIATGNRFKQDGDAPGDPKPTNDRRALSAGGEYRYALSERQQISFGLSAYQTRFPTNAVEDFNSSVVSAGWLRSFDVKGAPLLQLSGFFSRDQAVNKLADGITDKSKRVGGLRSFVQVSLSEKFSLFNSLGYTLRNDRDAYARATQVQFGRDKLADATFGFNWRFQPACSVRAQWFFSRNSSNIAIYEYSRHEISSNVRCDF